MLSVMRGMHAFVASRQRWFNGTQMLVAYLAPIYLSPLLARGTMEGRCAYCVLLVFEFWALNVIPAPVASSVPFVLLPLLGVIDPDLVAGHYINETMLFIVGVVLLALAMEGTNIYSRVALAILGACGAGVKAVFTALMALAFCATLLFENVLSTLIVMPVVECTMVEIENDALTSTTRRRMLRRASVMARLTSQQQPELPALAASSQHVGPGPMTHMSRRSSRGSRDTMWTPDSGLSSAYARGALGCRKRSSIISLEFAAKFEQEAQKYLLIRRVLLLSVAYSATLGAIGSVFGNPASRVLRMVLEERYSYDRLTMMSWLVICLPISAAGILACWMVVFVVFLKEYDCEEDDETKESIAKILEEKYRALGRFRHCPQDRNWARCRGRWAGQGFQGRELTSVGSKLEYFVMACILGLFLVLLLRSEFATPFAVPEEFGLLSLRDTTFVFVLVLLFFAMPQQPCDHLFSEYLLEWSLVKRKVPWSAFITYGGGLCVAGAIKESGLLAWLSSVLMVMSHWHPVFVQLVLMLITTVLTEVNNDTAAATVLIPIACDLAESTMVNPLYYGVPVTVACSTGLLLPVCSLQMALVHANLLEYRLTSVASVVLRFVRLIVSTYAEERAVHQARLLLNHLGFDPVGIRAGSVAAGVQVHYPERVANSSIFSTLHRWGRNGVPFWAEMVIMSTTAVVVGALFRITVGISGAEPTIFAWNAPTATNHH
ncbi:sodium-dependent low-affinity dicarboxylate transporter 1-like isoform X2 [Dermacentor albipictus]|uniref:sodium-dependent low-affinity dicarboxylate transporter 1-like isoform X2 n=1 Tax=Dermacentor albipictus TaxID=60249 RepID=UPI0031FBD373